MRQSSITIAISKADIEQSVERKAPVKKSEQAEEEEPYPCEESDEEQAKSGPGNFDLDFFLRKNPNDKFYQMKVRILNRIAQNTVRAYRQHLDYL
jgi:hypothetical protein